MKWTEKNDGLEKGLGKLKSIYGRLKFRDAIA